MFHISLTKMAAKKGRRLYKKKGYIEYEMKMYLEKYKEETALFKTTSWVISVRKDNKR